MAEPHRPSETGISLHRAHLPPRLPNRQEGRNGFDVQARISAEAVAAEDEDERPAWAAARILGAAAGIYGAAAFVHNASTAAAYSEHGNGEQEGVRSIC